MSDWVHDPLWSLDQFADVGPVVVLDLATRGGKRLELVSTPEDAVDNLVRLLTGASDAICVWMSASGLSARSDKTTLTSGC